MTISADAALQGLFRDQALTGADGARIEVTGAISRDFADALTRVVKEVEPRLVVEIGMAFGTSSLAILRGWALRDG